MIPINLFRSYYYLIVDYYVLMRVFYAAYIIYNIWHTLTGLFVINSQWTKLIQTILPMKLCKNISHALPAILTWSLISGCSTAFFYFLGPPLFRQFHLIGLLLTCLDCVFFACCLSNLFMATVMDPGIHPTGISKCFYSLNWILFDKL